VLRRKKHSKEQLEFIANDILNRYGFGENPFDVVRNNVLNQLSISSVLLNNEKNIQYGMEIYIFASPNVLENKLSWRQSKKRFNHQGQYVLKMASMTIAELLGIEIRMADIIGDWNTGTENSLLTVLRSGITPKQAHILASYQGKIANQLSVLLFIANNKNRDSLYIVNIPINNEKEIDQVVQQLTVNSFNHRSLLIMDKKVEVILLDENQVKKQNIEEFIEKYKLNKKSRKTLKGEAQFIGSSQDRDESQFEFTQNIIENTPKSEKKQIPLWEIISNKFKQLGGFENIDGNKHYLYRPAFSDEAIKYLRKIFDDEKIDYIKAIKLLRLDTITSDINSFNKPD